MTPISQVIQFEVVGAHPHLFHIGALLRPNPIPLSLYHLLAQQVPPRFEPSFRREAGLFSWPAGGILEEVSPGVDDGAV